MVPEIQEELLATIPHLRAFAIALCGDVDRADDLVQEALTRAIANIHQFTPGTSLQAWLFTILRNWMRSQFRRRRYEVEDPEGLLVGRLAALPSQQGHLDLQDLRSALTKLSVEQRETLLLVGAEGFSYEETAQITGTNIGTVKSRVNRARGHLARLMGLAGTEEVEPDPVFAAVVMSEGVVSPM
jgi:RNA polymerase sigma-70 factor, ECF subfamily